MLSEITALAKQFRIQILASGDFKIDEELSNDDFLLKVFQAELQLRQEKATVQRIKQSKLPTYKSFEEFDTDFQKGVSPKQLETLSKLEWLDSLFNLILIGPPGTGKTHIALAIGNKAVREGYKVAFVTMDNLIHVLKTQEISRKSQARLRWIRKSDLLIIDELGYLPVSRSEANQFFALISELYENASIIITSNKGFEGWAELMGGDAVLATALLDRLTHRCQVLNFTDESYRLAHRKEIFKTK